MAISLKNNKQKENKTTNERTTNKNRTSLRTNRSKVQDKLLSPKRQFLKKETKLICEICLGEYNNCNCCHNINIQCDICPFYNTKKYHKGQLCTHLEIKENSKYSNKTKIKYEKLILKVKKNKEVYE